ncbi:uncharacterized protein BJ212DRAFT_1305220 [Suillus subaureus]|uniref:Retrovirus-related Pol polyprotein from transposon TNT 1-94-like beta-barrel domain-containing protein n=1 Tax=Suillus subaureus TaxID=48587 RepID=A0A9P7J2Y4_9AGAM|nr:uncharacterized protein BJ212DRAFT_1305220 [Suillus subaureus]KAG1800684.1 hypothetical protein BJ212DRAFT_1305220 [Suillus subaureus]
MGSANAAANDDSEDDAVFAVNCKSSYSIPSLLSTESSDDNNKEWTNFISTNEDWFLDIDKNDVPLMSNWETDIAVPSSGNDTDLSIEITAEVIKDHGNGTTVKLYDSGMMKHTSPYHNQFRTLTPIPPKMFAAANKHYFDATGIGELIIEVPNGVDVSKLTLTEVPYSPAVGYTLVSISRLDKLRYSITFADGTCTI